MQQSYENISPLINEGSDIIKNIPEDYSKILGAFNLNYKIIDPYLQVGEINQIQGWILHISVVISQVKSLLEKLIPVFIEEEVPFKIPTTKDMAKDILGGNMGIQQVGKVISVYPISDEIACRLAHRLVELTQPFVGPTIPTDRFLGGAVYTRYGSFTPIIMEDSKGKKTKYIYDSSGQLMRDPYTVPFQLPVGRSWPFDGLTTSDIPQRKRIVLKNKYTPLFFMKRDVKGHVLKGIYLKGLFRLGYCVIKHGNKYTLSEDNGRTMHDRLVWQYKLHKELAGIVPLPRAIDFFQEDGDTFLVMEFVKCTSFYDRIKQINHNTKGWLQASPSKQNELLSHLIEITSIIKRLHQNGYVHRDIAPGNFLIDKKGKIVLVDLELAYSYRTGIPDPPFEYGTQGYISPQQQLGLTPTTKDDIYGLGALMIASFVGLSAAKFSIFISAKIADHLNFFLIDDPLSDLIASCIHPEPQYRPEIDSIQTTLELYRKKLFSSGNLTKYPDTVFQISISKCSETITAAIEGLTRAPMVVLDDHWYSKYLNNEDAVAYVQKEYIRYVGLYEGIGGVLYLLGRAKRLGFNIDACARGYQKGWEFIKERCFNLLPNVIPGLYRGAAGVSLSLCEGMRAELIDNNEYNSNMLRQCLNLPNTGLDLSDGIVGQGVAILQCLPFLDGVFAKERLSQIITALLDAQQTDGSWILSNTESEKENRSILSFGYGIPGITWFLLMYTAHFKDPRVEKSARQSLQWLLVTTRQLKGLSDSNIFQKIIAGKEVGDERKGILLTFIKAYETLGHGHYKKIVEDSLMNYPASILRNDFTQETGLASHGELYLEAFRVFGNEEWHRRASWIANVYLNTFCRNFDNSGYWMMEERNDPTADLMIGNSGIIHFLLRCSAPDKLGYRLLE